ncbi:MAG: hemin ABC transporter substrate-binding protein [Candidatus Hamiltonella defensa (Ceratovacuna japonica)]|uniref:heme/hemin ABC transporter substrate-binding protein n=1 Tax=Candidatus Williamhamiltonella defendens TaxID=138072 RepID=UPI0015838585|nr:ABC transporter substrate-binding protein [Candidatus Hamiltonella defensa]
MKYWFLVGLLLSPILAISAERIVTIGGDVSEIVYALGMGSQVVARDSTSLQPKEIQTLPDIGYMRQLNAEGILAMKPTLVLVTEQAQPTLVLKQISDNGVKVVKVPAELTLKSVTKKIQTIAQAVHQIEKGELLSQTYQKKIESIKNTPVPVKILFIMNYGGGSPMVAGQDTSADAVIRAVGSQNAMQGFKHYRRLSAEGVIASRPDLLLVTTESVQSLGGLDQVWQLPGMDKTPAGKNRRVLVFDAMALLGFGLQTPNVMSQLYRTVRSYSK